MKIVSRNELRALADFSEDDLPYFFTNGYESFSTNILKRYLLFYSERGNAVMAVNEYRIKSFSLLQVIYPPVTLKGERLSNEHEKDFLNDFVGFVKRKKLGIRIIQSNSYAVFKAVPDKSVSCPFGTYVIDMESLSEDDLFANIDAKGRNKIRNAQKNGVNVKWENGLIDDFYLLYKNTMNRAGMHCEPMDYFKEMAQCLGAGNILCGVAYFENKPQAALFIPYTGYSAYYLHGAVAEKMENPGAMDYLQWEALRQLKGKGVKKYDFVGARLSNVAGTKLEGIQNFKKKFGGELLKGYLWKMDIDKLQCKVFDGLLSVKHTLKGLKKGMDIIDEEREKAKP